jgi:2-C-methyl-D-erythritol 2,4-cyclodiphosphate synthase
MPENIRIGHGYDAHRLASGRKLVLGGVQIQFEKGLLGHSDADVLCHAVSDSILGALGLGDIGGLFPDSDPAYKDADSLELLRRVYELAAGKGFSLGNLDATIIAEAPRLSGYIPQMRDNLAKALNAAPFRINVKATTEEGMGFSGQGLGMAAHAVCIMAELGVVL